MFRKKLNKKFWLISINHKKKKKTIFSLYIKKWWNKVKLIKWKWSKIFTDNVFDLRRDNHHKKRTSFDMPF